MKLLTQEILKRIPAINTTDGVPLEDKTVHVKFFTPWTNWTWYAFEYDGDDQFFGMVHGHEQEMGYFSLAELQSITGPAGLKIERDAHMGPSKYSEVAGK